MRQLAPVFFSSVILLGSASALAVGDMNRNKKPAGADIPSQTSPTYSAPSAPTTTAPSAAISRRARPPIHTAARAPRMARRDSPGGKGLPTRFASGF